MVVLPYTGMTPEMTEGVSRIGTLFGLAAGTVFFIAGANVISFLLGRAFARSHETSVRVALGASRGQLARELVWDSIVISVAGGAFGILLAIWTGRVIPALLFDQDAERLVLSPGLFSIIAYLPRVLASRLYAALCRSLQPGTIGPRMSSGGRAPDRQGRCDACAWAWSWPR